MHPASQLVHLVQKKTGHINLENYLIKILVSESQQYVQNLTTTFHKNVKSTLFTYSTCRDHVKISVGIIPELHSLCIHAVKGVTKSMSFILF